MKKRELSPPELNKVIELKKLGYNWTEIQRETKVERRAAKREYEHWERDKKIEKQEAARFRVRAEAFHEHLSDLITLATSFVMNLDVLELPYMMEANAEQFCSRLFDQDLLHRLPSTETMEAYPVDMQSYRREQELLFESLKVHTREEVRWEALDEWKQARDSCVKNLDKLRRETSEVVNNFVNQEQNLLQSIKEASREDDPTKCMAEVVLRAIWKHIRQDKLNQEGRPWFETVSRADGVHVVYVKPRDEIVLGFPDKNLADEVTRICELAASNLCKGDMVQQLYNEVPKIKKASEELREMLNPVKLRPMILRTRCDLCP